MKKYIIFMAMAMMLYDISGFGQIPSATIPVTGHVMFPSTWDQFVPSIAIDKLNFPNILVSFTTVYHTNCSQWNWTGFYRSPNGADPCTSCLGMTTTLPNGAQSDGDATTAFDAQGQGYIMGDNGDGTGFFDLITQTDGATWLSSTTNTHVGTTSLSPMGSTDDMPLSPNVNNYYAIWAEGLITSGGPIKTRRSIDGGASFIDEATLGNTVSVTQGNGVNGGGPNIQTGPDIVNLGNNGVVYACWAFASNEYHATNIGFASSFDGGMTYPTANNEKIVNAGLINDDLDHGTASQYGGTWVNSFPSMAVDKSCGPHRGWIYIVDGTRTTDVDGNTTGSTISLWFSQDDGGTFTAPIAISSSTNVSGTNSPNFCWFPWVAVDDLTGVVSVAYYGYSGGISNTNTFVAFCNPADPTTLANWNNITVSIGPQTPQTYHTCRDSWFINYSYSIGIASYQGHAFPVWTDRRSGSRQIWIADIQYDAPQLASSSTTLKVCPTPSTISGTQSFEAEDEIGVSICGGTVSIGSTSSPATVSMTAGESIQIGQGFSTAPGSVYTAEIRTTSGCQTLGVPSFKTNPPNTTNTISLDNSITRTSLNGMSTFAYPNPTANLITVGALNNNYQNASFTVTDLSGRLIAQYNNPTLSASEVSQIIDASSYSGGLYIVTMTADNQKYSFKFAKE